MAVIGYLLWAAPRPSDITGAIDDAWEDKINLLPLWNLSVRFELS